MTEGGGGLKTPNFRWRHLWTLPYHKQHQTRFRPSSASGYGPLASLIIKLMHEIEKNNCTKFLSLYLFHFNVLWYLFKYTYLKNFTLADRYFYAPYSRKLWYIKYFVHHSCDMRVILTLNWYPCGSCPLANDHIMITNNVKWNVCLHILLRV